ncbi:LysR family transcriptional regulator [Entomohabitans teleogrylli]|uniref:LysR family transcriptional regulator n=1 Tax=Entomohabitans teleogrylli TaxID=1384589 RepID=UPI00073D887B|nr:LysR family transcriptional regulator [Entomohabitans teleogrylli]
MNLTIKQCKAFMALCKYRNFTRAAESVYLSQPAFSQLIYTLECSAGVKLFTRSSKKVDLTADGEIFQRIASNIIHEFNRGVREWRDYLHQAQSQISIVTLPSIMAKLLPEYIQRFTLQHAGSRFDIKDLPSEHCLAAVINEHFDMGIVGYLPRDSALEHHKLLSEKFYLVLNKHHPLAQKKQVELKDISHHTVIRFAPSTSIYQSLQMMEWPNQDIKYIEVEQLSTLFGLLLSDAGITFLPELTLYMFQHPDIIVRPLRGSPLTRDLYLIKKPGKILPGQSQQFYDFMLEQSRHPDRQTAALAAGHQK